jgi:glyoxylase-like metal-dependent hydrolase (beta-lactamase superfamily II)
LNKWITRSGYSVSCILSGRSNVFLLSGNGKTILIDTSPSNKWIKLKKVLYALEIRKIDFLILTHTHFDHAGNASKIKRFFGAEVIVNKEEAGYLKRGENIMPHGTNLFTGFIVNILVSTLRLKLNFEPCEPDLITDERFDLRQFGINGYILHTPGHSAGSQSIIIDDEIALTGDSMFGVFPRSVFPPFADNEIDLILSWGKLLDTNCSLFLPSHGNSRTRQLVNKDFMKRSQKMS